MEPKKDAGFPVWVWAYNRDSCIGGGRIRHLSEIRKGVLSATVSHHPVRRGVIISPV